MKDLAILGAQAGTVAAEAATEAEAGDTVAEVCIRSLIQTFCCGCPNEKKIQKIKFTFCFGPVKIAHVYHGFNIRWLLISRCARMMKIRRLFPREKKKSDLTTLSLYLMPSTNRNA